jgi:hypothetical protein
MFNPARAKNRSILCALRQYTPFLHPHSPKHYSFYAPSFRIGTTSHFTIIRSCLLLRRRYTPPHLASALTIFLLACGSNRLASLKHLNNPRGLLVPCWCRALCWCRKFLVVPLVDVGIPFVLLLSDVMVLFLLVDAVLLLVRCQGPPKGILAIDVRPSHCQCYP